MNATVSWFSLRIQVWHFPRLFSYSFQIVQECVFRRSLWTRRNKYHKPCSLCFLPNLSTPSVSFWVWRRNCLRSKQDFTLHTQGGRIQIIENLQIYGNDLPDKSRNSPQKQVQWEKCYVTRWQNIPLFSEMYYTVGKMCYKEKKKKRIGPSKNKKQ